MNGMNELYSRYMYMQSFSCQFLGSFEQPLLNFNNFIVESKRWKIP